MAPPNQEHLAGLANLELDFATSDGSLLRNDAFQTSMLSIMTSTTFADPDEHVLNAAAAAPVDVAPPPFAESVSGSDDSSNVSSLAGTAERGGHVVGAAPKKGPSTVSSVDRSSTESSRVEPAKSRPHHDPDRRRSHPLEKNKKSTDLVGSDHRTASFIEFSRPGLGPRQGSSIRFHESVNLAPASSTNNFMDKLPLPNAVAVEDDGREEGLSVGTGELVANRKPRLPSLIKTPKYTSSLPPPPPAAKVDEDFDETLHATKRPSIRAHPIGGYNPRGTVSTRCLESWDHTGKGYLDEIEYNMRKRDVDGDGTLSKAEIKAIVIDLLADEKESRLYCKASCWLLLMVALLAISNLGTSLAAAVLAKDTQADVQSGAILSKATDKIMAMQVISYTYELEELSDDEFEERRALVEREMESDPEHEDHLHRRLGRRNGRNRKIAYDQGKIRERDLHDIAVQCDGVNTVSIARRWQNSFGGGDYSLTRDVDALCGPGTVVRRKGKKVKKTKKNKSEVVRAKSKKKLRREDDLDDGMVVVEEQVTFKQPDGREVSFKCGRGGSCYGSGRTLLQDEAHPCHIPRDYAGASECDEGLVCRDPLDHRARRGTGECTRLRSNALVGMACDVALGVDACESGYTCHASDEAYAAAARFGRTKIVARKQKVGVVAGTCVGIEQRADLADTCDASLGDLACDAGYHCLGSNGVDLGGKGYGVCTNIPKNVRAGGVCNRSLGFDACEENYYCGEGGVGRSGRGLEVHVADEEVESKEARDAGQQQRDLLGLFAGGGGGVMTSRSTGYGKCTRAVGVGGKCFDHESCGWNRNKGKPYEPYQCVGLNMMDFGAVTLDGPADGDRGKFGFCADISK